MVAKLVTNRYTAPSVYIGQLIRPKGGNLNADARVCNYIGQGSKLAVGNNLGIRRSFVYGEQLTVATSAPYEAVLNYPASSSKDSPVRLFNSITGVELRPDQWQFIKIGPDYKKIQIAPSVYSSLAEYAIDYQSTSEDVLDPLPITDLRSIKTLGTIQGKAEFEDQVDFYIPYQFTGSTADANNGVLQSYLTDVVPDIANIGGSSVVLDSSASFVHKYNRFYLLEVTGISGAAGSYTATFAWSATPYSAGADMLPQTPLYVGGAVPDMRPTFTVDEATPTTSIQLELGIKLQVGFDATNFAVGDKFFFNGVGPGIIEWDSRYSNPSQYTTYSLDSMATGSGVLAFGITNTYTGVHNTKFKLQVVDASGVSGSRSVTFAWAQYGDVVGASSVSVVTEVSGGEFTLTQGIQLVVTDWGSTNFNIGDIFEVDVKAPRIYYNTKDNRVYRLVISTAFNAGADQGTVTGSYSTGTASGGFGSFETSTVLGTTTDTGYFKLPDNINFAVRNMVQGNINGTSYTTGDVFTSAVTSQNVIDWSLTQQVSEIRELSSFYTDVTGAVTGVAGTKYVILSNSYQSGSVSVVDESTGSPISFFEIPGTKFVAFVIAPTGAVVVDYEYRGHEPAIGQLYFLSAYYLRPQQLYNNPIQIIDRDDGRLLLGPSEMENHLYIMNEIVFDNGAPGAYYTQIYDYDGDGVINKTDVSEALLAHEKVNRITDMCLLSQYESLSDALAVSEKGNDPFEKREQMIWVGAPIGTPIGSVDTPDSLVSIARQTLQCPPQSVAMGTRVLVAPTKCTKTIKLESGISQTVILDGSFVAGATSAVVNSFTDPASTVLRKSVRGFDYIQTYTDPENLTLGAASITWLTNRGSDTSPSYRFDEDITVHDTDEEFQLISATTQKQYVTKVVRRNLDSTVISVVVPSADAGVAYISTRLAEVLLGLLGRGLIADYQNEDGSSREFDPQADILVLKDSSSLSLYYIYYAYWIKSPIKRLFGLYSVNTNDFGA